MTEDSGIYERIKALVDEEHHLTSGSAEDAGTRRNALEEELDQCWDLLRQRQARRNAGLDPDDAHARPVSQVETYLQ
jgi:hypothetical protein